MKNIELENIEGSLSRQQRLKRSVLNRGRHLDGGWPTGYRSRPGQPNRRKARTYVAYTPGSNRDKWLRYAPRDRVQLSMQSPSLWRTPTSSDQFRLETCSLGLIPKQYDLPAYHDRNALVGHIFLPLDLIRIPAQSSLIYIR